MVNWEKINIREEIENGKNNIKESKNKKQIKIAECIEKIDAIIEKEIKRGKSKVEIRNVPYDLKYDIACHYKKYNFKCYDGGGDSGNMDIVLM